MKAIATQTVIFLLIGIIVIGIFAYLIYKSAINPTLPVYECKTKLIEICRICGNTNWSNNTFTDKGDPNDLFHRVIVPCSTYSEFFYWSDNTCCGNSCCGPGTCGTMKNDCSSLMGTS